MDLVGLKDPAMMRDLGGLSDLDRLGDLDGLTDNVAGVKDGLPCLKGDLAREVGRSNPGLGGNSS